MIEYLINVVLIASPYWVAALIVFLVSFFYLRKHIPELHSAAKVVATGFAILGLLSGMFAGSNTYKNTVDYNPVQEQRWIEQAREFQPTTEIVDRTRQPLTQEDRAATAIDMRDRINIPQ